MVIRRRNMVVGINLNPLVNYEEHETHEAFQGVLPQAGSFIGSD